MIDRLGYGTAEIGFRRLLHLGEDEGADLARAVFLAANFNPCVAVVAGDNVVGNHLLVFGDDRVVVAPADQPLDGIDCVFRVGDALALGRLADQDLALLREGDHRRRGAAALGILDDPGLVAFHHGNARVRRSEVDADRFCHLQAPCSYAGFAAAFCLKRADAHTSAGESTNVSRTNCGLPGGVFDLRFLRFRL